MRYRISHITEYDYTERVSQAYNLAYLVPRNTGRQSCTQNHIVVAPYPAFTQQREDYYGNTAYHFEIQAPHQTLKVSANSEVEVMSQNLAMDLDIGVTCLQAWDALRGSTDTQTLLAREFLLDSPMIQLKENLREYAKSSFQHDRPLLSAVRELTSRIFHDFTYDPEFTTVATPLDEVLAHKRGVCQDFAHLEVGCLRAMGIPARYVSGYIETLPPPGQEKLIGADASHAWVAVYSPGEGWYEFDPTNDQVVGEQHIVTAWGRDYYDVTPVRGVIFGGGDAPNLQVSVDVQRSL